MKAATSAASSAAAASAAPKVGASKHRRSGPRLHSGFAAFAEEPVCLQYTTMAEEFDPESLIKVSIRKVSETDKVNNSNSDTTQ